VGLVEGRAGIPHHFLLQLNNNFSTCCLVRIRGSIISPCSSFECSSSILASSRSSSGSCNGAFFLFGC
jgi:hypothetical protein